MVGTVLIVAGFLALLIAPAAGAEHRLLPEAGWVGVLDNTSRGVMAIGVCCILIGFIVERRRNH